MRNEDPIKTFLLAKVAQSYQLYILYWEKIGNKNKNVEIEITSLKWQANEFKAITANSANSALVDICFNISGSQ